MQPLYDACTDEHEAHESQATAKVGVNRGVGGDKSPAGGTRLHQDVRLPDERLRLRAHGRSARRRTAMPRRPRIEDADLVILNTCHIREKAAEKVYSDLGRVRAVKEERAPTGSETLIAVAGCVAQAEGAEIIRRAPVVDLVVGPQSYHRLPELIARARAQRRRARRDGVPRRGQVREPARAARRRARVSRVPHRAGRLRQVLHLLRRALYARRGVLALRRRRRARGAPARRQRRARNHAARPERQRLPRRGRRRPALAARAADPPPGPHRWPRAAALHDQPSRAT